MKAIAPNDKHGLARSGFRGLRRDYEETQWNEARRRA